MTLADLLAALGAVVLLGAGFTAFAVVLSVLAPGAVDRARAAAGRPAATAALGLLAFVTVFVVAVGLAKTSGAGWKLLALATFLGGLAVAALGGTGIASSLGARTAAAGEPSLLTLLRGAALLGFSCLMPILGWLVVFPAAFLVALGAGVRALLGAPLRPVPPLLAAEA